MKFYLQTTGYFYNNDRQRKDLEILGFEFIEDDKYGFIIKDSDDVEIELNSLDDLIDFNKKYGDLILMVDTIEIYDGYRE